MPKYRPHKHIMEKLNKKGIKFTNQGTHLEVKEEDITIRELLIMRRFEKGYNVSEVHPDPPKKKEQRPLAQYSNPQWNDMQP